MKLIKNYKLLIILFITVVSFSACKKEKEKDSNLIGNWEVERYHIKTYAGTTLQSDEEIPFGKFSYWAFWSIGTAFEDSAYWEYYNGTSSINGKYAYNEETKTITGDFQYGVLKIRNISEAELVFYSEQTEVIDGVTYKYERETICNRVGGNAE